MWEELPVANGDHTGGGLNVLVVQRETSWGMMLATGMDGNDGNDTRLPQLAFVPDDVSIEVERTRHLPPFQSFWEGPGHEIIGFHRRRQVPAVDATSGSHQHVLRPLQDLLSHPKQVGLLKGFEAKIVIA